VGASLVFGELGGFGALADM